ncbi:MAG: ABC transporter ATP-binding protein [Anaerolineales bacterium]|nr:ABC transporter ATP-binding protein [Anaerolineales bacterium]
MTKPVSNYVLDIRNLSVEFATNHGPLKALRNVTMTVPNEKIVGLVGESGCGKSTVIFSILKLMAENASITHGEVNFEGSDILKMSSTQLRDLRGDRISMVFQDPMTSLNPVLSIDTQMIDIQYRSPINKTEKRKRAVDMLSHVGIPDAAQRLKNYPHHFSGGMRQRISIAMALLAKPALLLADEPTTALDATLEAQIVHRLRQLQKDLSCSILFVSHHLGLIAELCDQVVVMYAGEVVEAGDVRDIFHRAAHPYTQALLECDPARIEEKTRNLPTIPGDIPDLVNLPLGCIFENRCSKRLEKCRTSPPPVCRISPSHTASCFLLAHGGGK